ncbi:MAG: beta-N-acetylhexosaminidase [Ruminococcus sp.]|nr:beta-N-acetylhexosaminidase [Ruminococcus sp.]
MKKKLSYLILPIIICLIIMSFFINPKEKSEKTNDSITSPVNLIIEDQSLETLKNLSLEEKIAQMIIINFSETSMSKKLKNTLSYKPSGIILFKNNITTFDKTYKLINDIKNTSDIPMFVSIDQEGGRVVRITNLGNTKFSTLPSMQKVGEKNDYNLTFSLGKLIAEELLTLGINVDFAPVIDVIDNDENKVIGDRSFGTDYNIVSNLGEALAKGLQETGVIPVYKHFPGHGNTSVDSHYNLPIITKSKEELWEKDLLPFKQAIDNNAEIIMIGHLAVPNISNNIPASLSKEIITNLLKEEMNYKGLVITDALNMKAITDNYTEKEIYELAINAGVNILLMPNSLESAITLIKELIKENKISEDRINLSVYKILKLKEKLKTDTLDKSYIRNEEHQKIINEFN